MNNYLGNLSNSISFEDLLKAKEKLEVTEIDKREWEINMSSMFPITLKDGTKIIGVAFKKIDFNVTLEDWIKKFKDDIILLVENKKIERVEE